jgi:hypothetical protein
MPDDDELTEAERRAIAALPAEGSVPEGLEDRVVASLRERGLLGATAPPATASSRRQLLRLGLAAGLFGSGLGTGLIAAHRAGPAAQATGPLYLLLLYPGPRFVEGSAADEAARVAEYGAWAGRLHRASQLVSAEKLTHDVRLLEGSALVDSPVPGPQGFFLIRARDLAEAEAIARECPHLRHGGRVSIQAVDG